MRENLIKRFGEERGTRMSEFSRNMLIFPNLVINDIMAITVRTFMPAAPNKMTVSAWALGARDEDHDLRKLRLFNFLEFLGPGGFATPDDQEALENCQRGYQNLREVGWNDISKGMPRQGPPMNDDEEQMRCFWRQWRDRMGGRVVNGDVSLPPMLRNDTAALRGRMEDFLYLEADLLDDWKIEEWFALFAEGATYEVPPTGTDEHDPATSLFYIADDYVRLRERVVRLTKKEAHSEFPRSQQRHMISNVRITGLADGVADVSCNFVTYRAKRGVVDTYYGKHLYRIDCTAEPFRIKSKRSVLAMDMLYPGKLTIII